MPALHPISFFSPSFSVVAAAAAAAPAASATTSKPWMYFACTENPCRSNCCKIQQTLQLGLVTDWLLAANVLLVQATLAHNG